MARNSPTPVPKDVASLNALVASMDTNIKTIKDDLLPPLAKDAREARDTALSAQQSINAHIADESEHGDCDSKEAQNKTLAYQSKAIASMKPKIAGLQKWRWSLFGIAFSTLFLGGGFVVATRVSSAVVEAQVADNEEDIGDLEETAKALQVAQQEDRETYLRTIKTIPRQVAREAVNASKANEPTLDDFEDATDDLDLRPHEQLQLLELLKRARKRGNGNE